MLQNGIDRVYVHYMDCTLNIVSQVRNVPGEGVLIIVQYP